VDRGATQSISQADSAEGDDGGGHGRDDDEQQQTRADGPVFQLTARLAAPGRPAGAGVLVASGGRSRCPGGFPVERFGGTAASVSARPGTGVMEPFIVVPVRCVTPCPAKVPEDKEGGGQYQDTYQDPG